jgi:hypothetical protein
VWVVRYDDEDWCMLFDQWPFRAAQVAVVTGNKVADPRLSPSGISRCLSTDVEAKPPVPQMQHGALAM